MKLRDWAAINGLCTVSLPFKFDASDGTSRQASPELVREATAHVGPDGTLRSWYEYMEARTLPMDSR